MNFSSQNDQICHNECFRVDRGRWVVSAACVAVKAGQEVTDSYGSTYMEVSAKS